MAVPDRTSKNSRTDSEQDILNQSYDVLYRVLAVMMLGTDGTNAVRLKTNSQGEVIVSNTGGEQALQLDDVSTTNMTYIGLAPIGTLTSAASWQIKKLDESATPTTLKILWADGNDTYDNIWDNRTSLTYS